MSLNKNNTYLLNKGLFPEPYVINVSEAPELPEKRVPAEIEEAKELVGDYIYDAAGKRLRRVLGYSNLARNQIGPWNDWIDNLIALDLDSEKVKLRDTTLHYKYNSAKTRLSTYSYGGKNIPMTPAYAVSNQTTYTFDLYVDIYEIRDTGSMKGQIKNKKEGVYFGSIPQMIKGRNCILEGLDDSNLEEYRLDQEALKFNPNLPGGWFIIDGVPHTLQIQDRGAFGYFFNNKTANYGTYARIINTDGQKTNMTQFVKKKNAYIKVLIPSLGKKNVKTNHSPNKTMNIFHFFSMIGIVYNATTLMKPSGVKNLIRQFLNEDEANKILSSLNRTEEKFIGPRDGMSTITYWALKADMKSKEVLFKDVDNHKPEAERLLQEYTNISKDEEKMYRYIAKFKDIFEKDFFPQMKAIESKLNKQEIFDNLQTQAYISTLKYHSNYMDTKDKDPKLPEMTEIYDKVNHDEYLPYRVNALGYMLAGFLSMIMGYSLETDRNNYAAKSFITAAGLMQRRFKALIRNWPYKLNSKKTVITSLDTFDLSFTQVDKFINKPFVLGFKWYWTMGKGKKLKAASALDNTNFVSMLSHLGRVDSNIDRKGMQMDIRTRKSTEFNMICIVKTPENDSVGILRNLAITAHISIENPELKYVDLLLGTDMNRKGVLRKLFIAPSKGMPIYRPLIKKNVISAMPHPTIKKKEGEVEVPYLSDKPLFINGNMLGWCHGESMTRFLIKMKRSPHFPVDSSVTPDDNNITIYTNEYRLMAPYLIVNSKGELKANNPHGSKYPHGMRGQPYDVLRKTKCAELIGANELDRVRIAVSENEVEDYLSVIKETKTKISLYKSVKVSDKGYVLPDLEIDPNVQTQEDLNNKIKRLEEDLQSLLKNRFTHMLFDPSSILGVSASLLPVVNTNPGPRGLIAAAHIDQAVGLFDPFDVAVMHGNYKSLVYPTVPIFAVQNVMNLGVNKNPLGTNALVMFNSRDDTEEDSMVINKASAETMGLGLTTDVSTHELILKDNTKSQKKQVLQKPAKEDRISFEDYESKYRFISTHERCKGLPMKNAYLRQGDCIIGAVEIDNSVIPRKIRNISLFVPTNKEGRVSDVRVTRFRDNKNNSCLRIRVQIIHFRPASVGKKAAPNNAQKVTLGEIVPVENLPFADDGVVPDIIVNSVQLPSRMTMAYPNEMIMGLSGIIRGMRINASSFHEIDRFRAAQILYEFGWSTSGKKHFTSGITGLPFKRSLSIGPVYFQFLKHQSEDKIRSKAIGGPVNPATRAPGKGIQHGTTKSGGMELDTLIAHGASSIIKQRYIDLSNTYQIMWCSKCSEKAISLGPGNGFTCSGCKIEDQDKSNYGRLNIPYTLFMVMYSLGALGINIKINTIAKPVVTNPREGHNRGAIIQEARLEEISRKNEERRKIVKKTKENKYDVDDYIDEDEDLSGESDVERSEETSGSDEDRPDGFGDDEDDELGDDMNDGEFDDFE